MSDMESRLTAVENTVARMRSMLAYNGYCFSDVPGTSAPEFMIGEPKNPVHTYEEAEEISKLLQDHADREQKRIDYNARIRREHVELAEALRKLVNTLGSYAPYVDVNLLPGIEEARALIAKVEKPDG